jgi:hypothetical protein
MQFYIRHHAFEITPAIEHGAGEPCGLIVRVHHGAVAVKLGVVSFIIPFSAFTRAVNIRNNAHRKFRD